MTITEKDKRLLRFVACCAAIAVSAQLLIRPALAKRTELRDDLDSLEAQQTEWQEKIATLSTIDRTIEESTAARTQASEPFYKGQLETREMDDIITALLLKHGLFPQSLTLTEAVPGAVRAYLAVQEQADGSASSAEAADETGEAEDAPQTDGGVYIGTATLSAQGDVSCWLRFLDEVERSCKGLRVTNFSISDYDYVENNTQAVSTSLITGTLEIYLCGSGREADA